MVQDNQQLPSPPLDEEVRAKAEKRVRQKVELLSHIGTYLVINGFLVVVWALSGAGYPWFLWVMAGWGIGLVFHIIGYFTGKRGEATRDRMIQKEIGRIKKEQG